MTPPDNNYESPVRGVVIEAEKQEIQMKMTTIVGRDEMSWRNKEYHRSWKRDSICIRRKQRWNIC